MNVAIIQTIPEHAEDISRICSAGWRQTVQGIHSEEYQNKNVEYWYNYKKVSEDIVKGVYTHTAVVDGKIAGTIGGIMSSKTVSEIYVFYIDENYRYQGIGAKLLAAFTDEHVKRGAKEQFASVEEGNELGIPFYKARGFRQREGSKRFWRALDE